MRTESSTAVSGTVQDEQGASPPVHVQWHVNVPVASVGDVSLEPDQTRDITPNRYGNLSVKSRSVLTLHSGVYVFSNVQIEPDAVIRLDDRNGPVQILVEGGLTFRGRITSVSQSVPQALFMVTGTQDVFVERPFVGVLVAPNATVRFQAALPEGHRAVVVGKNVWLEPDTKIARLPFDWGTVAGPEYDPVPEDAPIHSMPGDDLDMTVDIPADGGATTTTTATLGAPETFTLPEQYTVAGGIIGNGTVVLRYGDGGSLQTCTYQGLSSTNQPTTAEELTKGSVLQFVSCSDGQPAGAERTATTYELEVTPVPGYPVTVDSPVERPNVCSDELELLTPEQTRQMRASFDWNTAQKVPELDENDKPTLYYAWIHVRDKQEALALKKLYIHVLSRPLFDAELLQYAGKCGTFTNPGDGAGAFVPAVIPGITYNKLIDVLTSDEVEGDRVIFDAVILRPIPADAQNATGSIDLQVLGKSGFRYLSYDIDPLKPYDEMVLDGGGVSKALTDAFAWVAQAARDVGEVVTSALNEIDQLFRGEVEVDIWAHALTQDPLFKGDVMVRGWGRYAGKPIGATGMQVKILQRMFDLPIPSTAQGNTNINGHVSIDATEDAEIRGRGLCVELKTDAAMVTDFLIANEVCDLRAYDSLTSPNAQVEDFRLDTLTHDKELRLHIDNTRLIGLYQADDVFRYSDQVMGYRPKRARILSGRWATTFTSTNDDGAKRLFAPCLNFPNSLSEAMMAAGAGAGLLAGSAVGSVIPGIGTPIVGSVGAIAAGTFASVVGNTDIVMSTKSKLRRSRGVLSHEYGHYMFCDMLNDVNEDAVDHVVWGTMIRGDLVNFPLRYTNEAFAEYFEGQVASGADYGWLPQAETTGADQYCSQRSPDSIPCWDDNLQDNLTGKQNIGRVATMFLDAFDGQGSNRTASVPTDADAWYRANATDNLTYNPSFDGDSDSAVERVALPGSEIATIAEYLAEGMEPFLQYSFDDGNFEGAGYAIDEEKILTAVDNTLLDNGANWCDRCAVLGLHEPGADTSTVHKLWESCQSQLAWLIGVHPDDPENLRINIDTCEPCPDNQISNETTGECEVCPNTVVGNTCQICTPDDVQDGSTMVLDVHSYDTNQSGSGDVCPNVFTLRVDNIDALLSRIDGQNVEARISPSDTATPTEALCEREFSMSTTYTNASGAVQEDVDASVGVWVGCGEDICIDPCTNLPQIELGPSDVSGGSVLFNVAAMSETKFSLDASYFTDPL